MQRWGRVEEGEITPRAYFVEKLSLVFLVVFLGTVFGLLVSLQAKERRLLDGSNRVWRGDFRQQAVTVEMEAQARGEKLGPIYLEVSGQLPAKEQLSQLEEEFWGKLIQKIPGENPSLQEVRTDLALVTKLDGYPFEVNWESSDLLALSGDGQVIREWTGEGMEEEVVELRAEITCYEWKWNRTVQVRILPPEWSAAEKLRKELEQYLKTKEWESREEAWLELPEEWQGTELTWKENGEDYGFWLWMVSVAAAAAVYYLKDRDLHQQVQRQQEKMKDSYVEVSGKMILYLGAGLTIRGTLERMSRDYLDARKNGAASNPVYEEILRTCRELKTGVPEAEAYENFGKRCGITEYIRLGSLLARDLKKGSTQLLLRLREEEETAIREQSHKIRRLGEEASTRLLFPMMLMLGVIMVMIMVPAFWAM